MTSSKATNITYHAGAVSRDRRQANMAQRGATLWLTGLSGSGKSTIGVALEQALIQRGQHVYRLDGDNIRLGLNQDLGFTPDDRNENIRRIGEVAKLFADSAMICICSFVSPYRADRQRVRQIHERDGLAFLEVLIDVPLDVAEDRDPKGLYRKARAGQIAQFTGVDAPFEKPDTPEITLPTHELSVDLSVEKLLHLLRSHQIIGDECSQT